MEGKLHYYIIHEAQGSDWVVVSNNLKILTSDLHQQLLCKQVFSRTLLLFKTKTWGANDYLQVLHDIQEVLFKLFTAHKGSKNTLVSVFPVIYTEGICQVKHKWLMVNKGVMLTVRLTKMAQTWHFLHCSILGCFYFTRECDSFSSSVSSSPGYE